MFTLANNYRSATYRKSANMVRAKARKRLERALAVPENESMAGVFRPRQLAHLWTITIQHRDGSRAILHADELPGSRLTISPNLMGKKIATALKFYAHQ